MRFNITRDPVQDTEVVTFPWNPEVEMEVRRWGHPAFQRRLQKQQGGRMKQALSAMLDAEGLKLKELRSLDGAALQERFEDMPASQALALLEDLSIEDATYLVESVSGLQADGEPAEWSEDVGSDLFLQLPAAKAWVQEVARRLEEDFQTVVEAASGNSRATSGGATPGVAETTSLIAPMSTESSAGESSPSGESVAG